MTLFLQYSKYHRRYYTIFTATYLQQGKSPPDDRKAPPNNLQPPYDFF